MIVGTLTPEPSATTLTLADLTREYGAPTMTQHGSLKPPIYAWWIGRRYVEFVDAGTDATIVDYVRPEPTIEDDRS